MNSGRGCHVSTTLAKVADSRPLRALAAAPAVIPTQGAPGVVETKVEEAMTITDMGEAKTTQATDSTTQEAMTIMDMGEAKTTQAMDSTTQGGPTATTGIPREGITGATNLRYLTVRIMPSRSRKEHIKPSKLPISLIGRKEPNPPARGHRSPQGDHRGRTSTPRPP
jgi:hypothetical protein